MNDRGSTQHSRRLDDAMAGETASLTHGAPVESPAQQWRSMEAPADGEATSDARISDDGADVAVNAIALDEIEDRSLLAISLRPRSFPARRDVLIEIAQAEHAEPRILAWLAALPEHRVFENVQEVWDALGGRHESRTRTATPPVPTEPQRGAPRHEERTRASAVSTGRTPSPRPRPHADGPEDAAAAGAGHSVGALAAQAVDVALRVVTIPAGVTLAAVRVARRWLRR